MAKRSTRTRVPSSLLDSSSGNARRAKTLSGRGTFAPGYQLVGTGKGRASNSVGRAKITKVVNPLGGQGKAVVGAGGRYANMNSRIVNAKVAIVPRTVSPNKGSNVVRPPRTALRVMTGRGTGAVRSV